MERNSICHWITIKEEPNSVEEIHFTLEHPFYESKITYKF
jgi:hypothetical protein